MIVISVITTIMMKSQDNATSVTGIRFLQDYNFDNFVMYRINR